MIFGIGCDIVKVSRFARWVKNPSMIRRFFNEAEFYSPDLEAESVSEHRLCEYYAVRFAAKEAFAKALGTGLIGFYLADIYIQKDDKGQPSLCVTESAKEKLEQLCGQNASVKVSLSHEKEFAMAFVVIEKG